MKHATNLANTFEESGEMPFEKSANKTQAQEVLRMIQDGCSNLEIINAFPSQMHHIKNLDSTRQLIIEQKYNSSIRLLNVHYIWGDTGVGKTKSIYDRYGFDDVYRVTNYTHPFDDYNCENVIVFEEFRSDLPIKDMLKYLDIYPVKLPCRYSDKTACYTEVYILSNIPLEKQYEDIQINEVKTWLAFLRRINGEVYEMLKEESPFEEVLNA